MEVRDITENRKLKGNKGLMELSKHIPEFEERDYGIKNAYTPNQFFDGIRIYSKMLNGSSTA